MDLLSLVRPHILKLKPYSSARDEYSGKARIYLDANENSLGSTLPGGYNRYPDPYQRELKSAIAAIKQVPAANIFLGNGSDEPIDLLIRAFCKPGHEGIITTPPTYGMYEVSAGIHEVFIHKAPLSADYQLDEEAIRQSFGKAAKLLFICSPNNPTGNSMKPEVIRRLVQSFEGITVVDEAYIDFSQQTSLSTWLKEYPQLVILQTFSKAWGLAALRLGMLFAHEDLVNILNKIKPPYNINAATQELALKALALESHKNNMVRDILEQRELLRKEISQLSGVEHIYPSDANFLLVKINDAHQLYHQLIQQEIVVRDRSQVQFCEGCLRITVGTAQENAALISTLAQLCRK
jgi:histidinol-phosphate aminotransferase